MDAGVGMGVGTGVDGVDGDMQSMESLECMEPGPASTPAPAATSACIRFWGFSTVFFVYRFRLAVGHLSPGGASALKDFLCAGALWKNHRDSVAAGPLPHCSTAVACRAVCWMVDRFFIAPSAPPRSQ